MNGIKNVSRNKALINTIHLAGQVVGTIWLMICLFGLFGFFFEGSKSTPKPLEILWIAIIDCFLIGFSGLIIAWWLSCIGGFISLFGFIIVSAFLFSNPINIRVLLKNSFS